MTIGAGFLGRSSLGENLQPKVIAGVDIGPPAGHRPAAALGLALARPGPGQDG